MNDYCNDCRGEIYWVDNLGCWYHMSTADMLTCPAGEVERAEQTEA